TQLRGSYRVENDAGRGFAFFLTVPVNLLWSSVLAVRAGSYDVCLRLSDIREATVLRATEIVHLDNHLCAMVRGEAIPLLPLGFIGGGDAEIIFGIGGEITVVIVEYGDRRAAFVIDTLSGVSDVIIKALPKPLGQLPGIAGYSVLGSGDPVCVLDGQFLIEAAYEYSGAGRKAIAADRRGFDDDTDAVAQHYDQRRLRRRDGYRWRRGLGQSPTAAL
ncbi:MAG TPA: chemotaxis protein CheW, partial [Candidatus Acidoferrales bacterium]|nr:chemotaxis protein CheW [Candidatus Acidoferrales bacterium]